MSDLKKYHGIFPAFYACYEDNGDLSPTRTRALVRHLLDKGVNGLYVGGSSGECIYLDLPERKRMLESVMEEAGGKVPVIAHVACPSTRDSRELAAHAQSVGVDAIAAIPPIYFHLPEYAVAAYWLDISAAAPDTDFIIYNIPQFAGVALTVPLLCEMRKNPRIVGLKNSSPLVEDIQRFRLAAGADFVIFNGPDEQLLSGLAAGATGGIGGTYSVMPELFLKIYSHLLSGEVAAAQTIQDAVYEIIRTIFSAHGNLYAVLKGILAKQGVEVGGVRLPLPPLTESDGAVVDACAKKIEDAVAKFC